jgi:membrane associated rhomboid family serine protease
MIAPLSKLGFFIIPPVIPGFIFGPLYLILSAYFEKRGGDNINHSAHIWGALFGVIFIIIVTKLYSNVDIWTDFVNQVKYYIKTEFNIG